MIALLIAATTFQTQLVVPELQPGCNQQFISAVSAVKKALSEEKFDEAARLAAVLPKKEVTYTVREDTIPLEYRAYALKAIAKGIEVWTSSPVGPTVKRTETNPDIVVSFSDELGVDSETGRQLSAVHFIGFSPDEPRVDSVIGLKRGDPVRSAETLDIASEMSFAIGSRLGLERSPIVGTPMARFESTVTIPPRMMPVENKLYQINVELGDTLRQAAAKHIKIETPLASAHIDVSELNGGTVLQGDRMPMTFQITNNGKNPLKYRVVPDCSCFILPAPSGEIKPGDAVVVPVDIDTMTFPGKLDKSIFVYTNDPELPVKRIPVKGMVDFLFRFITADGKSIYQLQKDYQPLEVFLDLTKLMERDKDFKITNLEIAGMKGTVEYEVWEGEMADVEIGEPSRNRTGVKLTLHLEPHDIAGRQSGIVALQSNSKLAPIMRWNFALQNGIAVNPARIYFGEVERKPNRAWAVLNAPGKKLTVTKVESSVDFIKASWEPYNEDNTKIVAIFDGNAGIGQFDAVVTVYTDDPNQPKIEIPVQGIVK